MAILDPLPLAGDFNDNGVLDAEDTDQRTQATRDANPDPELNSGRVVRDYLGLPSGHLRGRLAGHHQVT